MPIWRNIADPVRNPSDAQRRVLANIAAGREPAHGVPTRAADGGFPATWWSVQIAGWVDGKGELTDSGRAVIEE